ncbi:hypothetical protein RintRC_0798 [Richelia intracellularis]|nr:hypothetical protein RintRC_0798 [Richelia intracellularis]
MDQTLPLRRDVKGFTTTNIGDWTKQRVNQVELLRGRRLFFPLERAVVMVLITVEKERVF